MMQGGNQNALDGPNLMRKQFLLFKNVKLIVKLSVYFIRTCHEVEITLITKCDKSKLICILSISLTNSCPFYLI